MSEQLQKVEELQIKHSKELEELRAELQEDAKRKQEQESTLKATADA